MDLFNGRGTEGFHGWKGSKAKRVSQASIRIEASYAGALLTSNECKGHGPAMGKKGASLLEVEGCLEQ